MLKAIETENVIKNIIGEIIRDCNAKGIKTNETLAGLVIRLLVFNPDYGFISDQRKPLQREDVERLIVLCVNKLSEKHSPSLASIKMQVYFETNFAKRKVLIEENRNEVTSRISPLMKEIIETVSSHCDELEKLYRKMVVAITLTSGLGNPTVPAVLKEATVALSSVFPSYELGQFMHMSKNEKENQMIELTKIVTGIRLFNRDCHKGGEGIDDLPLMLQQASKATQETLNANLQQLMGRLDLLTTAVIKIVKDMHESPTLETQEKAPAAKDTVNEDVEENNEDVEENNEDGEIILQATAREKELIKSALATGRQLEVYIRRLLSEVKISNDSVEELLQSLQSCLAEIHGIVRYRTAIPTVQIYPQFIQLSDIWTSLQNEMVLLSVFNNISWSLHLYSPVLDYVPMSVLNAMVENMEILTDNERLEKTMDCYIRDSYEAECEIIYPDDDEEEDFYNLPLEYLGFCLWSLVKGNGALVPGNPNMGLCKWQDKYYAFSTPYAAERFSEHPDRYVAMGLSIVRKHPEMIQLLQLQEEVDAIKTQADYEEIAAIETYDMDVQTEVHPVPSYIDHDYTWNEWELKRRAIQLANISKCHTHSSQTVVSFFRRSISSQAAPDKTKGCQTKRDAGTNVPKLGNYIYGLRGRSDDRQRVITLTRPVHE